MRKAKIVATLGPSSNTVERISDLIQAGMNVARLNMGHGTHHDHGEVIENVRRASLLANKEVAILMDLQGPKIRVDKLEKPLELQDLEEWIVGHTSVKSKYAKEEKHFIPTTYKNLVNDAEKGCRILFDDGLIEAEVVEKEEDILRIRIKEGGTLKSNKGINLPDVSVTAPPFTEKDKEDLLFGLAHGIDYAALSFVRKAEDILEVKYLLHQLKVRIPIVAKIERAEAVQNIREIIDVADAVMIARGDMGVELGNAVVPSIQKKIINLCNERGKTVITATQMLESMITNTRPTRAEATDVANAIWDGTDAMMLSGETAAGKYPVQSVKMMDQIIREAEKNPKERTHLRDVDLSSISASIQVAASLIAEKVNAKWIIAVTQSGNSCVKMARFRPKVGVLGVTNSVEVVRKLCLLWGITPYLFEDQPAELDRVEYLMIDRIREKGLVRNGDKIVITKGDGKFFQRGSSNSIRVERIEDVPGMKVGKDHYQVSEWAKGKIVHDTAVCASCQNCVSICPHEIWKITSDDEQRTYIDEVRVPECTLDLQCVQECPTGAIEIISSELQG